MFLLSFVNLVDLDLGYINHYMLDIFIHIY